MPIKVLGQATFGVDSSKSGAQSVSENTSCTETVALNNEGDPIAVALSAKITEKTLEVIVTGDDSLPEIGENFEDGTVVAITKTSSNTDFQRYSVTVKKWDGVGA